MDLDLAAERVPACAGVGKGAYTMTAGEEASCDVLARVSKGARYYVKLLRAHDLLHAKACGRLMSAAAYWSA